MAARFDTERPSIFEERKSVSTLGSFQEDDENKKDGRKTSGWAFRPLKIKFKEKELEKIYKRSVYRQHQELILTLCALNVVIAMFMTCFVFLAKEKVRIINSMVCVCVEIMVIPFVTKSRFKITLQYQAV